MVEWKELLELLSLLTILRHQPDTLRTELFGKAKWRVGEEKNLAGLGTCQQALPGEGAALDLEPVQPRVPHMITHTRARTYTQTNTHAGPHDETGCGNE